MYMVWEKLLACKVEWNFLGCACALVRIVCCVLCVVCCVLCVRRVYVCVVNGFFFFSVVVCCAGAWLRLASCVSVCVCMHACD